jgi:cytochrome bd ubiquinol oxidase subunit II
MSAADAIALVMLASLALYVVLGGADFGGGVWDLFASGPRAAAQRALIERAIAPIWEANHVWLILIVVLLFSAFPTAYAVATTALHVPLTLMLIGIVLRGSAFVFRQYGEHGGPAERRWGRVFAVASTVTPVFLGVALGAVTSGRLRAPDGTFAGDFVSPWWAAFPFAVGALALALFAFLAATYLTVEADDVALAGDFRRRALAAQALLVAAVLGSAIAAPASALHFTDAWRREPLWWPLHGALAVAATGATWALATRRYMLARVAAVAQAVLMVGGWGLAQRPYLIAPDVTIAQAAAPARTLALLGGALVAGAALLFPALAWLYRVFKSRRR